jgi:hypothetical protein
MNTITNNLPVLERLFSRECRSFAQYMGETWPWGEERNRSAHDLLQSILADERRWATQLSEIITDRGGQPLVDNYPDVFIQSNLHYVAMDYLMQRLADYLEAEIAELRKEAESVAGDAPVQALIAQMIERKTGQVAALRKLSAQ